MNSKANLHLEGLNVKIRPYDFGDTYGCEYGKCKIKPDVSVIFCLNNEIYSSIMLCRQHLKEFKRDFNKEYEKIEEYLSFIEKQKQELKEFKIAKKIDN